MDSIECESNNTLSNNRNGNANDTTRSKPSQNDLNNSNQSREYAANELDKKNQFMLKIQDDFIKINSQVDAFENYLYIMNQQRRDAFVKIKDNIKEVTE